MQGQRMTAATLFSGIGAPEVAMPEWDWIWHAEIEKFPVAVMAARHPQSVNLGDVTADDFVDRALAIGRPDVVVFGSPCQSYSVAGQRLGDRSGEKWLGGQACPFVGGQVAHVGEGSGSPGYPLECLAAAEGGLQGESIRQLRGQKSGGRYVAARLVHLHLFWIWAMSSWMCGLRMPKRMNSWSVSSAFRFSPVAR